MRERRKEPREGSEIDPETACILTVGAPALMAFEVFVDSAQRWRQKIVRRSEMNLFVIHEERAIQAGVTAYLLYNGSATYIQ